MGMTSKIINRPLKVLWLNNCSSEIFTSVATTSDESKELTLLMSLLANVLGWSAVGVITRSFQLGLQNRPQLETLGSHGAFAAGFGALGYYLYGVEQEQKKQIEKKKNALLASRASREQLSTV